MQGAAAQARNGVLQTAEHVIQWQQVFCRNATTMASSAGVSTVLFGVFGPIGASAVVVRLRHFSDGLGVQAVAGGEGTGARLRRFELGSNSRRRAGAAVKNACHSASSS